MSELVIFEKARIEYRGVSLLTGRHQGRDVIVAETNDLATGDLALVGAQRVGEQWVFPASYDNMLTWEKQLAPKRRLIALNRSGYVRGFGAGNRIVVSEPDIPNLRCLGTFGGWDGIYRGMMSSAAPFWFIQQSIVRELIPEGVDVAEYPGIGHTGGYGPRELLRAGLFAFASLGGYGDGVLPIGADADHAIVTGSDERTLADSMSLNKLAIGEARDYTKFTVDTSHLFGFPVELSNGDMARILSTFRGRRFLIANTEPDGEDLEFRFDESEVTLLAHKYWKACSVHKEIYDHVVAVRGDAAFDYELSLDETPGPTEARELLFYMVSLYEVLGLPEGAVASAGPNIGFVKRHDFEGDLEADLRPQVSVSNSILRHFGAMLSVHSADGVRAWTGKGVGVDQVLHAATLGSAELKVADVYQEILWEVLAESEDSGERELFLECWHRTYEAVSVLAKVYSSELVGHSIEEVRGMIGSPLGRQAFARKHGEEALLVAQKTLGYGLPVFRLAVELLTATNPDIPNPTAELFRRFMFLTFKDMRKSLFETMTPEGWERFAAVVERATLVRLKGMGWTHS